MRGFLTVPLAVTPAMAIVMVLRMGSDPKIPRPAVPPPVPGRDEREGPVTLDEIHSLVLDGFRGILAEQRETREMVHGEVARLETKIEHMGSRVEVVESALWGSKRPPPRTPTPPSGGIPRPRLPSVSDKVKTAEETIAELSGRMLRTEAEAAAAREEARQAREAAETGVSINKQQSRAMGLAKPDASPWRKILTFFLSRKGAEFALALLTLATAAAGLERAKDAAQRAQDALQHLPATQEAPR